jgi:hypothetical protein
MQAKAKLNNLFNRLPSNIRSRIIIDENNCWLWQGFITPTGYGYISFNYKQYPTHRFVYELLINKVDIKLQLDHLCRVRHCINPTHLEEVTRTTNVRRGLVAKLNIEDVRQIHTLHKTGNYTLKQLGNMFKVTHAMISHILTGARWKDVYEEFEKG